AAVAAAPLALVGVEEVAEQPVADEFVVEAQRVVAGHAGLRARHLVLDTGEGLRLVHPVAQRVPGIDPGDHAGPGIGQQVVGGTDHEVDRLIDLAELEVAADRRELGDPGQARVAAPGFKIVEEQASAHFRAPAFCSSVSGSRRSFTFSSSASQSTASSESMPWVAATSSSFCTLARSSASAYGIRMKVTIA